MNFDWRTPFELAFELALFSVGWILVMFIGLSALMITISLVRGFLSAVRKNRTKR
jgi:hypothetical protein